LIKALLENINMSNYPDFSIEGYQLIRLLGNNKIGGRVTYLASTSLASLVKEGTDKNLVVIKQFQFAKLESSWAEYEAYEQEIAMLRRLNHSGIPRYLNSFQTPDGFGMVQEYINADSLAIPRFWTPEQIKQIAVAVLNILVYLQSQNPPVIHRDIKPENILVDDSMKVYLVDFGFARMEGAEFAANSVVKGTLGFMPPEQLFNRPLTKATDLYGLGATLICLLTQTQSTEIGNLIDEVHRIHFRHLLHKLNPQFIKWLEKMVAPNCQHRAPNAAIALTELQSIDVVGNALNLGMLFRTMKPKITIPIIGLATLGTFVIIDANGMIFSSKPSPQIAITPDAVVQLLTTRECRNCNLRGADLSGTNLRSVDLKGADLRGANLRNADLRSSSLENVNLTDADLRNADLRGADLKDADLTATKLEGANLNSTDFRRAIMPEGFIYP
jgi:serine/threonine protein kinase